MNCTTPLTRPVKRLFNDLSEAITTFNQLQATIVKQQELKKTYTAQKSAIGKLNDELNELKKKMEFAKHHNPNKLVKMSQEELDLIHFVPISEMGEYLARMELHRPLRDAFEDPMEATERERTLFGNPYKKIKKTREIAQEVILNEMEEEASHEFDAETVVGMTNSKARRRRTVRTSFTHVPPLGPTSAIIIPDWKALTWDSLAMHDFEAARDQLIADHIESVARELEIEKPQGLNTPASGSIEMEGTDTVSLSTLVPETASKLTWEEFEPKFYEAMSKYPRRNITLIRI
jgi:hypothetical protein